MISLFQKLKIYGPIQFIKFIYRESVYIFYKNLFLGHYSQLDEDSKIDKFFKSKSKGFYVDIGANDPVRFSNTYFFYKKGWRGINIEPDVRCFDKLVIKRPRDINLNVGIGQNKKPMRFYNFAVNTLSTFSSQVAKKYIKDGFKLREIQEIKTVPLALIFKKLKIKKIDFISIDTEGNDLDVLKSNDWKKFKPELICVEVSYGKITKAAKVRSGDRIDKYLKSKGYHLQYKGNINNIFVKSDNI